MNEQHVVGNGLRTYLIAPETHLVEAWSRFVTVMLIVTFMGLAIIPPGPAMAEEQASGTDRSDDTGIKLGTLPVVRSLPSRLLLRAVQPHNTLP